MKGKVVLVTGADGGLGTLLTRAFLDAGATVVRTSRKTQQSDFTSRNFTAIAMNLSSLQDAKTLASEIWETRCTGTYGGGFAGGNPVAETDDSTWQRMLDLNLNSLF